MKQLKSEFVTEDSYFDGEPGAAKSPWGRAQEAVFYDGKQLGEVVTAGHGGMFVRGSWQSAIPKTLRKTWYEEDCAVLIPMYFLYDSFKALYVDFANSGKRFPRIGVLQAFGRMTKDEIYSSLMGWYRVQVDFALGQQSGSDEFDSDDEYNAYLEGIAKLKANQEESERKAKDSAKLKVGDIVEFESPLQFGIGSETVSAKRFKVAVYGQRSIRFIPQDTRYQFVAQIRNWRNRQFKLIC